MKSLRRIINTNLVRLAVIMMVLFLCFAVFFQLLAAQSQTREHASATFLQVEQILEENKAELLKIESEYRETCLMNAETIAYIIRKNDSILGNVQEFRKLAQRLEIDEIHIFDETGRIFTGSHPEYYDYTFDSGEQMNFFKPLLTDRSLRLCQEITPNTAEGKLVQYSALWSADKTFIVQVGMYPDAVLETTAKNELSYIFSLLQGNPGVALYAFDAETGEIVGSTSGIDHDKYMNEIGLELTDAGHFEEGGHAKVNGVSSYCIFKTAGDTILGYAVSTDTLYRNIFPYTCGLAICLLLVVLVLMAVIRKFTDGFIIDSIATANEGLRTVAEGDLNERIHVRTSQEFSELSDHINNMIQSLLATTDKMSFVLDRTNMRIGVYEYNTGMKTVRMTEHVPEIFQLGREETEAVTEDCRKLQELIVRLKDSPVPEMENTYRFVGDTEVYIKQEEITNGKDVLGIVVDVTEEFLTLRRAEAERDLDLLTGLCNRRGMERRFDALFAEPEALKHGALAVIDFDNMKQVNDTYGHAEGDAYIKSFADLLKGFGNAGCVPARMGGDEFVLLLYGYETEASVAEDLQRLGEIREDAVCTLRRGQEVPIRFSFGHVPIRQRRDFDQMILEADRAMYEEKARRKKYI